MPTQVENGTVTIKEGVDVLQEMILSLKKVPSKNLWCGHVWCNERGMKLIFTRHSGNECYFF